MLAMVVGTSGTALAADRIAFVDVAKVFDDYEKTKVFDKELAEIGKEKQTIRDNLVLEIRRLKDELALLSDKGKSDKQQGIDQKLRELQAFDQGAQRELGEKREKIIKEVFKDIDDVMKKYGEKNKFDFILNERLLLFRSDKFDVTEDIIGELNARYKR